MLIHNERNSVELILKNTAKTGKKIKLQPPQGKKIKVETDNVNKFLKKYYNGHHHWTKRSNLSWSITSQ